jgi:hypothetical protein
MGVMNSEMREKFYNKKSLMSTNKLGSPDGQAGRQGDARSKTNKTYLVVINRVKPQQIHDIPLRLAVLPPFRHVLGLQIARGVHVARLEPPVHVPQIGLRCRRSLLRLHFLPAEVGVLLQRPEPQVLARAGVETASAATRALEASRNHLAKVLVGHTAEGSGAEAALGLSGGPGEGESRLRRAALRLRLRGGGVGRRGGVGGSAG